MKRILSLLLVGVILIMCFASCKKDKEEPADETTASSAEESTAAPEGEDEKVPPKKEEEEKTETKNDYDILRAALPDGIGGYALVINDSETQTAALVSAFSALSELDGWGVSVKNESSDEKRVAFVSDAAIGSGAFKVSAEGGITVSYSDASGLLRALNCLLGLQNGGYGAAITLASVMSEQMPDFYDCELEKKNIFGNKMLFQQNKPFTVSGTGDAGVDVLVRLKDGDTVVAENNGVVRKGSFAVTLEAQKGSYTEYDIEIYADYRLVTTISDVVFGELWISAGQSNMEYTLSADADGREIELDDKYLRSLYSVREVYPYEEQTDYEKCVWLTAENGYIKSTSAVAYFFSAVLREKLDVPVGYINCAVGGSSIREWLSRDTIDNNDELYKFYFEKEMYVVKSEWKTSNHAQMTSCYNLRIAPITEFEVAGMIWYQGEADISAGNYKAQMEALHSQFCEDFGFENEDMPLIYVTIQPYVYSNVTQADFAEFQLDLASFALENPTFSAIIANNDVSPEFDYTNSPIHPRTKLPIANRMAQSAMSLVYGGETEISSPVLVSSEVSGGAVYMTFGNVGDGLGLLNGSYLKGFLVCGADGVFERANAEIVDADTVKVWSEYISEPYAASYAFYSATYTANLCSTLDGNALYPALPAITEQTDGMVYTSYLDWADCDLEERFHLRPGNADISRSYPTWILGAANTAQTALAIDNTVKVQGTGALKIAYSSSGIVSVTPTMDAEKFGIYELFRDTETSFTQYGVMRLYIGGLDSAETFCGIVFTDTDGTKYTANLFTSTESGDFDAVCVDLNTLESSLGGTADASVLENIRSIEFIFEVTGSSGDIYIDGVSFGCEGGTAE